jgi:hypothetical protein
MAGFVNVRSSLAAGGGMFKHPATGTFPGIFLVMNWLQFRR